MEMTRTKMQNDANDKILEESNVIRPSVTRQISDLDIKLNFISNYLKLSLKPSLLFYINKYCMDIMYTALKYPARIVAESSGNLEICRRVSKTYYGNSLFCPLSNVSMSVLTVIVIVIMTIYKSSSWLREKGAADAGVRNVAREVSREVKRGSDSCTLVYYLATAELMRYCSTKQWITYYGH